MHRRSFLVGLGTILTAPYVARVQTALAQQAIPAPLITEAEASRTLIAERTSRGFTLYFDMSREPEPFYTYRDMLSNSGVKISMTASKSRTQTRPALRKNTA